MIVIENYSEVVTRDIDNSLLLMVGDALSVEIPSIDCICRGSSEG